MRFHKSVSSSPEITSWDWQYTEAEQDESKLQIRKIYERIIYEAENTINRAGSGLGVVSGVPSQG